MYPELLPPLLGLLGVLVLALVIMAVRVPLLRRLAGRNLARRRTEGLLVVIGSVLGTAIIVGSLVVGDTLDHSVRQVASQTLGPVDERVVAPDPTTGRAVADALAPLVSHPDVDGVLSMRMERATVVSGGADVAERAAAGVAAPGSVVAEPKALVWEVDFTEARSFGAPASSPTLLGSTPERGEVVVNEHLARSLGVGPGSLVTLYLYGKPVELTVDRVLPAEGLAGLGLGAMRNRNAWVHPGLLGATAAARQAEVLPSWLTVVSNRGGVESGEGLTPAVKAAMQEALTSVDGGLRVDTPKADVLDSARDTGAQLGSMFLLIGSFSIIAGVLLLVNIFVMLAEERKSQLGMLRAVGMSRSRLVGAFVLEGAAHAVVAAVIGVLLGIGVGYGVAWLSQAAFGGWSEDGGLAIEFAIRPVSLVNGFAMGLVIGLVTIVITSVRISRINIIAAIRDLPVVASTRSRRWLRITSSVAAVGLAALAVPVVADGTSMLTYLVPALAAVAAVPALAMLWPSGAATAAALFVVGWTATVHLWRPTFDSSSVGTFVIVGLLLNFAIIYLVSRHERVLLAPVRSFLQRPTENGFAARLAVAYPTARRFRTGATMTMYALVVSMIVLIGQINAILDAGMATMVGTSTGGYPLRVEWNPASPVADPERSFRQGSLGRQVTDVIPLVTATALATDPGGRTSDPLPAQAVGVPSDRMGSFPLDERLPELASDDEAWARLAADPGAVLLDLNFGNPGGPPGSYFGPGDTFEVLDPLSGTRSTKTIVGILENDLPFNSIGAATGGFAYAMVMDEAQVRAQFAAGVREQAALLRTAPGVDDETLGSALQGAWLDHGLQSTSIAAWVEEITAANQAFFRLMEGFLALGLAVGISGLGVIMVRAVRERRRTIGVLRALGVQSATVQKAFLAESSFVAAQGIAIGVGIAILTSYLLWQNAAVFANFAAGFVVAWDQVLLAAVGSFVLSLLATWPPARRASRIRPAVAVRVAD